MPARYPIDIRADARQDLIGIMNYVARDNPVAASEVYEQLVEGIASLQTMPERGSVVSDISRLCGMEIRRLLVSSWSILYRVSEDLVIIYRVIHTRRDREMHFVLPDMQ